MQLEKNHIFTTNRNQSLNLKPIQNGNLIVTSKFKQVTGVVYTLYDNSIRTPI